MTEYFDVYDLNRNKTGKIIARGDKVDAGEFLLAVDVILYNRQGQVLLQKRTEDKSYCPGFWGLTGGAVDCGEDTRTAIIRETKEEIGVEISPEDMTFYYTQEGEDGDLFVDVFIAECNFPAEEMQFQKEEVSELKWCSAKEFEEIAEAGKFMPTLVYVMRKFLKEIPR